MWNAGLLLYNLILSGFNCRNARVRTYGYNVSVIAQYDSEMWLPPLRHDSGDIKRLSEFFPRGLNADEGFNGNIVEMHW